MKKLAAAVSLMLTVSVMANLLFFRRLREDAGDFNSIASSHRFLSAQLFFRSLDTGTVELFLLPPAKEVVRRVGEFSLHVRPLYVPSGRIGVGPQIFARHNQDLVLDFACFQWEKDRQLAQTIIGLLSHRSDNAKRLLRMISEDSGELTYVTTIERRASAFVRDEMRYDLWVEQTKSRGNRAKRISQGQTEEIENSRSGGRNSTNETNRSSSP